MTHRRHAWIDASAGVSGDMLLGALLDAGADLERVRRAIDAVIPESVRVTATPVTRAGLRALKADVIPLSDDPPHRTWPLIRELLHATGAPSRAATVFARLAATEARVHGVAVADVHFHEVGALDSIADVVGICAALDDLGIDTVSAGEVALGSGRVRTTHGDLPVPVPAVAELAKGWPVCAGGTGELATPTGMAAIRALAVKCEHLPSMTPEAVGIGAGARNPPERPNIVRVVVGASATDAVEGEEVVILEANVDDLDPRLWPSVLAKLLASGACDAWLVPILMKKGRPAHTLSVLCEPVDAPALRTQIFRETSTLGVRDTKRHRVALARTFVDVELDGMIVAVKVGHRDGVIVQVMPEFDDIATVARQQGRPERLVLQDAMHRAIATGIVVGAELPELPPTRPPPP